MTGKHEKEADEIAIAWGFKAEIQAMNKEIQSMKEGFYDFDKLPGMKYGSQRS